MSSSPIKDNTSEAGSGFRTPTMAGRGRSQSVSSTDSQSRRPRSRSIATLSEAKKDLTDEDAIIDDGEVPEEFVDCIDTLNDVDVDGNATAQDTLNAVDADGNADDETAAPGPSNPPFDDTSFESLQPEVADSEEDMPETVKYFLHNEHTDPAEQLELTIKRIANAPGSFRAFDSVAAEFLELAAVLIDKTGALPTPHEDTEPQVTYHAANIKALQDLHDKYADPTDAAASGDTAQPPIPDYRKDIGYRELEHHGDECLQSMLLDTILLVNDKVVGNPGEHALTNICLTPQEEKETLIFQTSYLYPEHSFTYAQITVSRWTSKWSEVLPFLEKVGVIVVPMIRCQDQEPKLETLSTTAAAKLLGVGSCSAKAARYTLVGAPRLHSAEYAAHITDGPIREGLDKLASMIDGEAKVKIDLVHPIYEVTDDLTLDPTVKTLEGCTEGWRRDADNPLSIYFAKSPSKRMLDLGTVPKGDGIPFMDQLPPLAVFDTKEQYYVTMAIGNQQEKEFHDRQHGKLSEFEIKGRFLPDRRSLHPKSKQPQELFMLISTSSVGPNADYLLPRNGDSADVVLKGVFTKPQLTEDMGNIDNDHIARYIQDTVTDVRNDNSIESEAALDEKLRDELKLLCVRDEKGEGIAANHQKLRDNLVTIKQLASNDTKLVEFIKANRTWLAPPPPEIDENNIFGEPVRLRGHRINVPSSLWPAQTHVWKLRVPVDKASGNAKLPLILDLPYASTDKAGSALKTTRGFAERCNMGEADVAVKIKVVDSDKTHKAEMYALQKLLAAHTVPIEDRPSLASLNLVEDLIKAKLRDGRPLKEIFKPLEKLRQGTHEDKKLQGFYNRLTKDKHGAVKFMLDDKKAIKYIHGPPGTGKSHLALWITGVAVMSDPPTTGADDDWDQPLDLGPQIKPEDFDKVDFTAPRRAVKLTDEQKAAASSTPPRTKVLIVSGQNTAVDDLVPRFIKLWKELGGEKVKTRQPVVLRLYSWESEGRDFIRRFAKVGRHIQRNTEDAATGGIVMRLLDAFSDKADEFDREGRKARSANPSIVDKAVELYQADRKATENRKYDQLAQELNKVQSSPDQIFTLGKVITRLVMTGPQTDALAEADVIFGTMIGVADKTFRRIFRPHYIIADESPRDKEIAFLILLAHFSPRAYFCFGDHKQLSPVIFSKHQHRKYKPPRSFKQAGVNLVDGDGPGEDEQSAEHSAESKVAETEQGSGDSATGQENLDAGKRNKEASAAGGGDDNQGATDEHKPEADATKDESKHKEASAAGGGDDKQGATDKNEPVADATKDESKDKEAPAAGGGDDKQGATDKDEPKADATKDESTQEEVLPNPATFAPQMETSAIDRLMEAGHPAYMLSANFRQHGTSGEFFNKQFYNGNVNFHKADDRFSQMDKAAVKWLQDLSGEDQIKGNTLMIDMNSLESCEARSFLNVGHVNYILAKVVDLLADPKFSPSAKEQSNGKVVIIAPYEAQRNLYEHELQKRGTYEMNSKREWVPFDKSRVEIRTHQGAQGYEASVVVVDLTRSDTPGMTGHSDLVNVCSSRSICAQLVLINTSTLDHVESKNSPVVRNLVAWVQFHQKIGMLVTMDAETAKEQRIVCFRCFAVGHKGAQCSYTTKMPLLCIICGGKHHPRGCLRPKKDAARAKAIEEIKKPSEPSAPVDTALTTRTGRNEREEQAGKATRNYRKIFRNMGKPPKDSSGDNDNNGGFSGGNTWGEPDADTSGGGGGGWAAAGEWKDDGEQASGAGNSGGGSGW